MTGFDSKRQMAQDKVAEPAQKPVAWQWLGSAHFRKKIPKNADKTAWNPLYTTPPQRPWVGLTYEDMVKLQKDLYDAKGESVLPTTFAMAVEAKLKEKNT
jgi:hypothetical protein